jgi:branched-chain amino acid transport system permease protein
MQRRFALIGILGVVALFLIPVFFQAAFLLHIGTLIFFYIALTSAWNIPAFGGKLSLGHASFFGIGAYSVAILYVKYGVSPWLGLVVAVAVSLLGGVVMSVPLIRLRGPFFTLASIAFAEALRMVAIDWRSLTNGSVGLNIPFRPAWGNLTFTSGKPFYCIALILALAVLALTYRLRNSALGYHLRAAASDEEAAGALGVNTSRAHFLALMWSSGLTGAIAVFFTFFNYVLEPNTAFSLTLFSLQPALNGIIGGFGTVWGPVIGALLMTPLGEFLRFYLGTIQQGLNFVVYGIMLIATVNFMPGGIVSLLSPYFEKRPSTSVDREAE